MADNVFGGLANIGSLLGQNPFAQQRPRRNDLADAHMALLRASMLSGYRQDPRDAAQSLANVYRKYGPGEILELDNEDFFPSAGPINNQSSIPHALPRWVKSSQRISRGDYIAIEQDPEAIIMADCKNRAEVEVCSWSGIEIRFLYDRTNPLGVL